MRKTPVFILTIILLALLIEPLLTLEQKQTVYAISLLFKSLILFLLPLLIFCLIYRAMTQLSDQASKIMILIFSLVCISNFISTFISHFVGQIVYGMNMSALSTTHVSTLKPAWLFTLPIPISNAHALLLGLIAGFVIPKFTNHSTQHYLKIRIHHFANALMRLVTSMVPFFIAGFIIKMDHEHLVSAIFKDYASILIIILVAQFSYIGLLYLINCMGNIKEFAKAIRAMLPAAISGFTTMSSAASMPLTLIGAEENAKNKPLAASVIPATVNIHLIGDCFAIPILAYAILKNFGIPEPSLGCYLIFAVYFVIAKFSIAAVPGGGILVMLPILESYLGFDSSMLSLITALYILFDPFITSANILGNGAFAKTIDNLVSFYFKKKTSGNVTFEQR